MNSALQKSLITLTHNEQIALQIIYDAKKTIKLNSSSSRGNLL